MIGGTKYFAHMGLAGAELAQFGLISGSVLLAFCIYMRWSTAGRFLAQAIGLLGALFAANFILPLGMGPYIYPLGTAGIVIPLSASVAGFVTAAKLTVNRAAVAP
jgi:hypothetical protein